MAENPCVAWLNGRFVGWQDAVVPIEDRGLQFGESIYEVFPVTAGRPRLVAEHSRRMAHGATALGIGSDLPDHPELERIAELLIAEERVTEGLVYAQVTGGDTRRAHLARTTSTFFAYLRPYRFPRAEDVKVGLRAFSLVDERWAGRDLKTTMLLPAVLAKREAAARGADEALLVGADGEVHEGASTNVFVVLSDRLLHPSQSRHLLPGTVAPLAVQCALELGLTAEPGRLNLDQLAHADEVFCTATSKLAMPVLELDGKTVGGGAAGPVVRGIARRLRAILDLE